MSTPDTVTLADPALSPKDKPLGGPRSSGKRGKAGSKAVSRRQARAGWAFVAPFTLAFILVFLIPIGVAIKQSFTRKVPAGGGAFGGGGSRTRGFSGSAQGSAGAAGSFEDILSGMFGGRGSAGRPAGFGAGAERGADLRASLTLPFRLAVTGGEMPVIAEGRSMTVRIPAGVRDGQKIKLRGKGRPGSHGGENGDLVVTLTVEPHPVFGIDGNNLTITLPVTFAEAALGATVSVPTFDGGSVRVKVAPGSPSGKRLRVRGKGVPASGTKDAGDLIVTIEVVVPERLTDAAREAVEAFAAATQGADPRAGLAESAAR